jgi:alkanesulfonate monooxygenase SsuD/methylene tetrahydromethanopterin reductase-like flavin-dependent oxidoreductase (luciferase family)
MKLLWTQDRVEYSGRFYSCPPVQCFPKPATKPHPPFLIGVRGGRVFERIARYGDGWLPAFVTREDMANGPDEVRAGRRKIAELAEAAGRDPALFQTTVIIRGEERDGGLRPEGAPQHATRDLVARFEEAGADRVLVSMHTITSEQDAIDELERIATAVL